MFDVFGSLLLITSEGSVFGAKSFLFIDTVHNFPFKVSAILDICQVMSFVLTFHKEKNLAPIGIF